jgi:hypothetical protein
MTFVLLSSDSFLAFIGLISGKIPFAFFNFRALLTMNLDTPNSFAVFSIVQEGGARVISFSVASMFEVEHFSLIPSIIASRSVHF